MEQHNFERLKAHILPLSRAQTFPVARAEWDLVSVELSDHFDNCPCGQEIKEHCYIKNRLTGHETYVGNVCINRFLGIDTGTLFDGLRRIKADVNANANLAVINYAQKMGYLFDQEYAFLLRTKNMRKPTPAQAAWKLKINQRILKGSVVSRRTVRGV